MVGTVIADVFWIAFAAVLIHEWRNEMAMNERCRDCGKPADFRCEAREVGERRVERVSGVDKVVQPYLEFFLCASCCAGVVAAGDPPPRQVKALPHHQRVLQTPPPGSMSSSTPASLTTGGGHDRP